MSKSRKSSIRKKSKLSGGSCPNAELCQKIGCGKPIEEPIYVDMSGVPRSTSKKVRSDDTTYKTLGEPRYVNVPNTSTPHTVQTRGPKDPLPQIPQ